MKDSRSYRRVQAIADSELEYGSEFDENDANTNIEVADTNPASDDNLIHDELMSDIISLLVNCGLVNAEQLEDNFRNDSALIENVGNESPWSNWNTIMWGSPGHNIWSPVDYSFGSVIANIIPAIDSCNSNIFGNQSSCGQHYESSISTRTAFESDPDYPNNPPFDNIPNGEGLGQNTTSLDEETLPP